MIVKGRIFYFYVIAVIQLVGLALFSTGFFPYKTYLPGFSSFSDAPLSPTALTDSNLLIEPEFDRLVFIVIDALRNDFIFQDTGFGFVRELIEQGTAIPFTAKATAPTVTMPRIKALTTGTVPSFLDAILNIAEADTSSSLQHHDNWLYQFKTNGKHIIHFFGDDTWIRLFPGLFTKTDGTTSFYVSDTVQVDHNVTRHIQSDVANPDWDTIILHYLGLDHIGHLGGPKSPLMAPKQQEMDKAIESIFNIIMEQDKSQSEKDPSAKGTLVVVCGDHGMNDAGNHGGSSTGETSAAMVFISPKYKSKHKNNSNSATTKRDKYESPPIIEQHGYNSYDEYAFGYPVIDQVDLVPTLSALFGLPIPKNSLGKVILELYNTGDARSVLKQDKAPSVLRALQLNAHQLGHLLGDEQCTAGHLRHQEYLRVPSQALASDAITSYLQCINEAKDRLSSTASDYNLQWMTLGCILMILCAIVFCFWSYKDISTRLRVPWMVPYLVMIFLVSASAVSVFASSFIEEEHYIWYYYVQTWLFILGCQSFIANRNSLGRQFELLMTVLFQMLLVRAGILWRHFGTDFINEIHPLATWHVMTIALCFPVILNVRSLYDMKQTNAIDVSQSASFIRKLCKAAFVMAHIMTSMLVLAYKLRADGGQSSFGNHYDGLLSFDLVHRLTQVELGQLIYNYAGASFLLLTSIIYVSKHASFMNLGQDRDHGRRPYIQLMLYIMTPLFILLSKSQDAIFFLFFTVQLKSLLHCQRMHGDVPIWVRGFLIMCLSQFGFFLLGRSNSIASVDLSNAYIGVEGYDTLLIGAITFCSNWSGSLWWCVAGWVTIFDDHDDDSNSENRNDPENKEKDIWISYCLVQSTFFSVAIAALSLSVTLLREHLFIWTVFSPKYLFQIAWTVLYFWLMQMGLGTFISCYWYSWSKPHTAQTEGDDIAETNSGHISDSNG